MSEETAVIETKLLKLPTIRQPWKASFDPATWEMLMRSAVTGERTLTTTAFINSGLKPDDPRRVTESVVKNFLARTDIQVRAAYLRGLSEYDQRRWYRKSREINEARYASTGGQA